MANCTRCDSDNNGERLWLGAFCQSCWEGHSSTLWWGMVGILQAQAEKIELQMEELGDASNRTD